MPRRNRRLKRGHRDARRGQYGQDRGGTWLVDTVKMLTERAVPVCGHLGLTPQSVNIFGGYKIQGRGDAGQVLLDDALALEAAGAQLLVLECVPVELAKRVTEALSIPVIGIGAGNVTDGQILVMHDAFGITGGHIPKFAKNFLAETGDMRAAVRQYIAEVESGVIRAKNTAFTNFSNRAGWRRDASYPAYRSSTDVGLISAAPSGRIIRQLKESCCANH